MFTQTTPLGEVEDSSESAKAQVTSCRPHHLKEDSRQEGGLRHFPVLSRYLLILKLHDGHV